MKKIGYVFLLSCAFQLQAMSESSSSNSKCQELELNCKDGHTWDTQLYQSIEEGEDFVRKHLSKGASLTNVDPVSGLTPVEIAVEVENYVALETILSVAAEEQQKLAMNMAFNMAERKNDVLSHVLLLISDVKDDGL